MTPAFQALLQELRTAHETVPALRDFVAFPDDLETINLTPRHLPCADYMEAQNIFQNHPLARAFYTAGRDAMWRDTYAGTDIGDDFMNRFGCYCAIGNGGAWISQKMAGYVVTMPPNLHYPWHHHPAEELYFVLAGEATFYREGDNPELLRTGDASFHASNQPHAMQTHDHPVMAYVCWRNHLDVPPVLTDRDVD